MKKKFLGLICLLYSSIIIYVWIFDKMKNFLAPNMQIYLKISLLPMLLMFLILCFNEKINYKFKISDTILILPLILLILSGDGKLTTTFANNRNIKTTKPKVIDKVSNKKIDKEEIVDDTNENYDFTNVDYDVVDEAYDGLSTYITYSSSPDYYTGKTIRVKGFTLKSSSYLPDNYFMIGKYSISCCAADAGFMGFIVKYDLEKIKDNAWYEIEGVLQKGNDKENLDVVIIKAINVKEIDSKDEEQYIYPCYVYDNGLCAIMDKYDIK